MKGNKNILSALDYTAIIMILLSSGTAYFFMYHAGMTLLALLLVALFIVIKRHSTPRTNSFVIIYTCLILLSVLLYGYDPNLIGYVIFLYSTLMITSSFSYDAFRRGYLNAMVGLSTISLLLHVLYLTEIITPILRFEGLNGLYGYYLYAFHVFGGGRWGMSTQLSGVFWEPGIYQMALNIAILMNLDILSKANNVSRGKLKFAIIVIAIILTRSTTGYLVLGVILVGWFLRKSKNSLLFQVLTVIAMLVFWAIITYSQVVAGKFSEENSSYLVRSNDWIALYKVIQHHPFIGSGVYSKTYTKLASKYGMISESAGIMLQTAQLGLCWLVSFYYSLYREYKKRKIEIPCFMYIVCITFLGMGEPLMYAPFILINVLPFKNYNAIWKRY